MTNVWFIGSWGTRTITKEDWAGAGFVASTVTWSVDNGWSIDDTVFSSDQLLWLDADPGFLLGQTGPRVFPTPGPDLDNYSGSAYAYYRKIKDLYGLVLQAIADAGGLPGGGTATQNGENHWIIFNTTSHTWPARPDDDLPVMWVGGISPDNAPIEQRAGDMWQAANGDVIPIGPILTALQLLTGAANKIPYWSADGVAGELGLSTATTLGGGSPSDTVLVSQKAVKAYIDAQIAAERAYVNTVTINDRPSSESNYQLTQNDIAGPIRTNSTIANTITIPDNTTTPIAVGSIFEINQFGSGQTSITKLTGVTVISYASKVKLTGQYSTAVLRKDATNTWFLYGDLST